MEVEEESFDPELPNVARGSFSEFSQFLFSSRFTLSNKGSFSNIDNDFY